jgi:hypothetical protein
MKTMLAIFLTILCWGTYGPILHKGQESMLGHTRLLPFICVGLAYFIIAVVVPLAYLFVRGEQGNWTTGGTIWSLIAGAAGAIGALGIILALDSGGSPVFVMPLVFGGAPVVNAFFTIFMSKSLKQVGPIFIAGLIMVALGAFTTVVGRQRGLGITNMEIRDMLPVLMWIAVVALSWGAYGPVLHKGQMKMAGSRLRPLICVGLSYFAIAVLVPLALVNNIEPNAEWTFTGTVWSLGAGSAGAIGALGIIMAFNFGGKPIYVMPLVFGGAPIVNTFVAIVSKGGGAPSSPFFYAGLILTAAGAVMVLVFAPRGGHAAPATPKQNPTPAAT